MLGMGFWEIGKRNIYQAKKAVALNGILDRAIVIIIL